MSEDDAMDRIGAILDEDRPLIDYIVLLVEVLYDARSRLDAARDDERKSADG